MVKSTDIARSYEAVERDRIRQAVRRHKAKRTFVKNEVLPRAGIVGMLVGWSLINGLNSLLNNKR